MGNRLTFKCSAASSEKKFEAFLEKFEFQLNDKKCNDFAKFENGRLQIEGTDAYSYRKILNDMCQWVYDNHDNVSGFCIDSTGAGMMNIKTRGKTFSKPIVSVIESELLSDKDEEISSNQDFASIDEAFDSILKD